MYKLEELSIADLKAVLDYAKYKWERQVDNCHITYKIATEKLLCIMCDTEAELDKRINEIFP